MRIISGKFRGLKLQPPVDFSIRPTSDRLKESLFSILESNKYNIKIENSNVIDVRTKNEFNNGTYKTSQNIPLSTIEEEIDNISDNSYVFCAGGYRSVIACSILMKNGKKDLINVLEGYSGINKQIKSQ